VGKARLGRAAAWSEIQAVCANLDSPLRCVDSATETQMRGEVDIVHRAGNTVGGIFEVVAHNVITGLGSHAQWDEKLDGRLAQAVMSIQAVKGVEIGAGITAAVSYGSEVMDEIGYDAASKRFTRATNRAGGLECGITNGEDVVVRGYLKPISTLRSPLATADMVTKLPITARMNAPTCALCGRWRGGKESDGVICAGASADRKIRGGDSLAETRRNFEGYQKTVKRVLKPQITLMKTNSKSFSCPLNSWNGNQCATIPDHPQTVVYPFLSVFICVHLWFQRSGYLLR